MTATRTLLELLSDPTFDDTDLDAIYAQTILGWFGPHSPAVLANEQPNGFSYFLSVEQAQMVHEHYCLDGNPNQEITAEEWQSAAHRVIDYANGWHAGRTEIMDAWDEIMEEARQNARSKGINI